MRQEQKDESVELFMDGIGQQAIRDWRELGNGTLDRLGCEFARATGFMGPTDELLSFFHGTLFEWILHAAHANADAALDALGAPKNALCPCQSCTTDAMLVLPRQRLSAHRLIYRTAAYLVQKGVVQTYAE